MTWKEWIIKNASKRSRQKRKECSLRFNAGELSKKQYIYEMSKFSDAEIMGKIKGFFLKHEMGKIKQSILGG